MASRITNLVSSLFIFDVICTITLARRVMLYVAERKTVVRSKLRETVSALIRSAINVFRDFRKLRTEIYIFEIYENFMRTLVLYRVSSSYTCYAIIDIEPVDR